MSIARAVIVSPKRLGDNLEQDGPSIIQRITLSYKDFPDAAATSDFILPVYPGGVIIEDVFGVLRQDFAGGGVGTATISVGSGATKGAVDFDDLALAKSVFTGVAPALLWSATTDKGDRLIPTTNVPVFVNGTTPYVAGYIGIELVVDTTAAVLTSGKIDIFLKLRAASVRS